MSGWCGENTSCYICNMIKLFAWTHTLAFKSQSQLVTYITNVRFSLHCDSVFRLVCLFGVPSYFITKCAFFLGELYLAICISTSLVAEMYTTLSLTSPPHTTVSLQQIQLALRRFEHKEGTIVFDIMRREDGFRLRLYIPVLKMGVKLNYTSQARHANNQNYCISSFFFKLN